jgi:signal transduction histidine kinase/ligand-binding sensor domain-containing protein
MRIPGLLILLTFSFSLPAQQKPVHFEKFGPRQGLSHQLVRCIFKDRQGFLWIGTAFGLNRYDGINFKKWYHVPGDAASLPHNTINTISQDKQGYIWIGTHHGFARMDPFTGLFTCFNKMTGMPANAFDYNTKVYIDSANRIWAGNDKGIFVADSAGRLLKQFPVQLAPAGKKSNPYVDDFLEDDHFVYAATSYGLYRVNKHQFSVNHYLLPVQSKEVIAHSLTRLCKDQQGIIWAGTWISGLARFDPATATMHHKPVKYAITDVEAVTENGRTVLYACSFGGLLKIEAAAAITPGPLPYQQYLPDKSDPEAISHHLLEALCRDDQNNLWIGTEAGLNKTRITPGLFQTSWFDTLVSSPVPPYSIVPAKQTNTFWVMADAEHLLYNGGSKQFSRHPFTGKQYFNRDLIKAGGDYFLATRDGLLQFNSNAQLQQVYDTTTVPSLQSQHISKAFYDSKGNIWLSMYRNGIVLFNPVQKTFTPLLYALQTADMAGQHATDFYENHNGNIWIATAGGALRYDYAKHQFTPVKLCETDGLADCNEVKCFYETGNGQFFIGTADGLYAYQPGKPVQRIELKGPGISNSIRSILEDKNQCLWICTNNGLLWYQPRTGQKKLYTQMDGLPTDELGYAFYKYSDSAFWIGIENGITMFNPLQMDDHRTMPVPVFTAVHINEKPVSLIDHKAITIAYNESIGFDFLSLSYFNMGQNQYQFMLEGLDDDWKNIANEHSLRFSNLPAGTYTFKVRQANIINGRDDLPATFAFTVKPPFWKTAWFIGLCAVSVASGAYALYRYRLNQAVKMERLRMRIATDLHDDIGATLSAISMYSEAVKKQIKQTLPHLEPVLDKMGETSLSMVGSMSDIVWAINPNNDEGEKLVERIENYAREVCSLQNVQLQIKADKKINTLILPLEYRKNIYLILKEAINNAMKYAGCTLLQIRMQSTGKNILLAIEDNGEGFDPLTVKKGNGLTNMHLRAKEINARFSLQSQNTGTLVQLEVVLL